MGASGVDLSTCFTRELIDNAMDRSSTPLVTLIFFQSISVNVVQIFWIINISSRSRMLNVKFEEVWSCHQGSTREAYTQLDSLTVSSADDSVPSLSVPMNSGTEQECS